MLSVVVYGRNDNHGYNLHKRVALSLNCFSEILKDPDDEIIFVDYNTPDEYPTLIETIQDTLTEKARSTVRVLRAYASVHRNYAEKTPFPVVESIARNIGFRRTNPANKWVLSTNTDMILAPRSPNASFSDILGGLEDGFYLLPRFELPEALWELLDRHEPGEVINRVRGWGKQFAINEVINRPLVRYDAPGDFQLALREDMFKLSGMDERMLLGNVHVDSNLCRRMEALRGGLRSLITDMFGYHCAHTRTATFVHGRDKVSNDFERFVREVKDWRLPDQEETWGKPAGQIEEIVVGAAGSSLFEKALERAIKPLEKPYEEINWGHSNREAFRYSIDHVASFLASAIAPLPKDYSIGVVPSRPDMLVCLLRMWSELGFRGEVGLRRDDMKRMTDSISLNDAPMASHIVTSPDSEFFTKHDVYLFEFGLISEAGDMTVESDAPHMTKDADSLSSVLAALEAFVRVEKKHIRAHPPRRCIFVGVANNRFEPMINDTFDVTHTPFTSRIRQGFVHVSPQAGAKTGFDPRTVGAALQEVAGRSANPPADEIVRTWAEIHDLLEGRAQSAQFGKAHVDLLRIARDRGLIKMDADRSSSALDEIDKRRQSRTLAGELSVDLLPESAPPLASINKLADPADWERPEWFETVRRFFGGEDAYSTYNRHRDVWLQSQVVRALRQSGLGPNSDVLVVSEHPDDIYALLSQICRRVYVCRSAFEASTNIRSFEKERWLDVGVLPRPGKIEFLEEGLAETSPASVDFVLMARNCAQQHGAFGLIRALENAARALRPGGRAVLALDIAVGRVHREDTIGAAALTALLEDVARKTGLEAVEPPDFRLSPQALDMTVDAKRELDRPHFVREHSGGLVAAGLLALSKQRASDPEMWRELRQPRLGWVLRSTSDHLQVSDPFQAVDGAIRVHWDAPVGAIARLTNMRLPGGSYVLPISVTPDPHVPDERSVLSVEVTAGGNGILALRDIVAREARAGEVLIPFTVKEALPGALSRVDIQLNTLGRAGLIVKPHDLRPASHATPFQSRMDLAARNTLAPSAWRRGEEIIVEPEAEQRHFLYGPYRRLSPGWWRLSLDLSIEGAKDPEFGVVDLEILIGANNLLPPAVKLTQSLCAAGPIVLSFHVPAAMALFPGFAGAFEFRLQYNGGARVVVKSFIVETTEGPCLGDTWMFTFDRLVDRRTGSALMWLPAGRWSVASFPPIHGGLSVSTGDRALVEKINFEPAEDSVAFNLPKSKGRGPMKFNVSAAEGFNSQLVLSPEFDLLRQVETTAAQGNGGRPIDASVTGRTASLTYPQALASDALGDKRQRMLIVGAAPLSGPARTPERPPGAADTYLKLAGANSLRHAMRTIRSCRFETAIIDFADSDFNMQPIPRVRRVLALMMWLRLIGVIRSTSRRMIVEVHELHARRSGPAGTDALRRGLFRRADEITLPDDETCEVMQRLFPEVMDKVTLRSPPDRFAQLVG
jgi:hypothetical protein